VLVRRLARLEVTEDAMPATWWESLAVGDFHLTSYRLVSRTDGAELARASTWDMNWFGRRDGRSRLGLIDMEVPPAHRRKGYGRHLVNEILKLARAQSVSLAAVQTGSTNTAAMGLYQSLDFLPVESATLYRRPGSNSVRAG
jgi:ribosomal protein S18 acetylase RimI-like enzyme